MDADLQAAVDELRLMQDECIPQEADAIQGVLAEVERLRSIIASKLHQRECRECDYIGWYADCVTPYCLCDKCRSQNTRRVKPDALVAEEPE